MAKYRVTCTIIYNGTQVVDASTEREALEKVKEGMRGADTSFVNEGHWGDISFDFGEITADYAEPEDE